MRFNSAHHCGYDRQDWLAGRLFGSGMPLWMRQQEPEYESQRSRAPFSRRKEEFVREPIVAAFGCILLLAAVQAAAQPERPNIPPQPAVGRTGKERLSDKASDEQRVNDCKVPPNRRTQQRPTHCP